MEHERMEYPEAIEWLAKRAKMEIPTYETEEEKKARAFREKALEVMKTAARFYFDTLRSPKGAAALEYLRKRGLSDQTIVEFGLGYSPDYESLPDFLSKKGYDFKTLKDVCLVSQAADGRHIDFFGGRVIIPIINARDQVIAFGGRTLEGDKLPKYKNSGGTPLFDKRRVLFGLNLIKKLQQAETVNDLVLVEGYMDVISLRQGGIKNAVASMGTSLTPEQCRELRKYANTVYVCFDGDAAGQLATWRSLDLLSETGLEVRVMTLPEGLDPDDLIKKEGGQGFLKCKSDALPLVDFKIKSLASRYNLNTADGKNKFAKSTLPVLAALDPIGKDLYIKEVSKLSGLSVESIANSLAEAAEKPAVPSSPAVFSPKEEAPKTATEVNARVVAARFLLGAALAKKGYAKTLHIRDEFFDLDSHKKIAGYILRCKENNTEPRFGMLYDIVDDKAEIDKVEDAVNSVPPQEEARYYEECLETLQKNELQRRKAELLEKIKNASDDAEKDLLKAELLKLLRR
jgi:DNA primase